ncbi:prostatic acid phosphatase-like isoform X2 [Paramacrobiotus metropolitanus]|uniref:prostatic acid phosphatase-like isoform X2 n=1 Tax=Paramacrobiotus metropolitanus TaxID=2943436 RepID=UPI002445E127|nr:prostatic acid phosphatase-like isoform X2 [Paramacrobiotus metropolitanus]
MGFEIDSFVHGSFSWIDWTFISRVSYVLAAFSVIAEFSVKGEGVADLKQVHVVVRHGARAPLQNFDGSGYYSGDWPHGLAQLTAEGIMQQYQLGSFLRRRYSKFLTPDKELEEIYVQSTDHDRTLQSALAMSAGLFLPSDNHSWESPGQAVPLAKMWQPIPVHTTSLDHEYILKPTAKCQKLERLNRDLHNMPKMAQAAQEFQETDKLLAKYIAQLKAPKGHKTTFWERVPVAADMFASLSSRSLALPPWMRNIELMNNVTSLADLQFMHWVGAFDDEERSRIVGGALLNIILERMRNSTKGEIVPKFFLYSGHDSSVAGLLSTLQVYNSSRVPSLHRIPLYNAFVIMELFANNTVRITYSSAKELRRNNTEWRDAELFIYKHPNCSVYCPLVDMIEMNQRYVVANWEHECDDRNFLLRAITEHVPASGAWATIGVLGVLLVMFVGFRWWKDRKHHFNNRPVASQSLSDSVISYRTLENLNA